MTLNQWVPGSRPGGAPTETVALRSGGCDSHALREGPGEKPEAFRHKVDV